MSYLAGRALYGAFIVSLILSLGSFRELSAYEDRECLVCHKDYGRLLDTIPEEVARLYVDQKKWERDVHYEVAGLNCDDCHLDATPDTHPEEGLQKVNCGECHEEEVKSYYSTPHWTKEIAEGKERPDCVACHPPHSTLAKDNPCSLVSRSNVGSLCLSCHEERRPSTSLWNRLALFRISAHRKSDMAVRFDPLVCITCHHAQAVGHGEDSLSQTHCGRCHATEANAGKVVFGPFHLDPIIEKRPFVFSVKVFNLLIFVGMIAVFLFRVVKGFSSSKGSRVAQQS